MSATCSSSGCRSISVAVISIIVEDENAVAPLNELLHECAGYIIGRMGLPYRARGINIICVAIDAPNNQINALTGALGRIEGINAKAAFSNV